MMTLQRMVHCSLLDSTDDVMSSFCIYCGVDGDDDADNCLKVVLEEEEEEEVFDEINELPQVSLKNREKCWCQNLTIIFSNDFTMGNPEG